MNQKLTVQGQKQIRDLLEDRKEEFGKALQNNIDPGQFVRAALTMVSENVALMDCTPSSLYSSLMKAAQLSLSPDGMLGQAYLVPYGDQAQLIIGYKGLRELALRTGKYRDVRARIVYKKDDFNIGYGDDEFIEHTPFEGDRGEMRGVYAVAVNTDGSTIFEFMWANEVNAHRDQYSRGWKKKDSMWQTAPERAWEKTVIRRLCNRLQLSVVAQGVLAVEDRIEAELDIPERTKEEAIDVETGEILDDDQSGDVEKKKNGIDGLVDTLEKKTVKNQDIPKEDFEMVDLKIAIEEKIKADYPRVFWKHQVQAITQKLFGKKYDINEALDKLNKEQIIQLWENLQ